ncbi:hypothetical protein ACT3SZ_10205 [Corynebacterium sp. AOP40-9SA-29]|uniref:hypothetical protein n=1 Tax=Corynebacterium sp. AOP40-9SA-29 TaxID=3457677 RepID=UPI0040340408
MTVFGIDLSQVRTTSQALDAQASAVAAAARGVANSLPAASCLPGGRTFAALAAGTDRVADAVTGESVVLDVIATDLITFAEVVGTAEQDAATCLSGTAGVR